MIYNDNIFIGYYCVLNVLKLILIDGVMGNECNLGYYCLEGLLEGIGCLVGKNIFFVWVLFEVF